MIKSRKGGWANMWTDKEKEILISSVRTAKTHKQGFAIAVTALKEKGYNRSLTTCSTKYYQLVAKKGKKDKRKPLTQIRIKQ